MKEKIDNLINISRELKSLETDSTQVLEAIQLIDDEVANTLIKDYKLFEAPDLEEILYEIDDDEGSFEVPLAIEQDIIDNLLDDVGVQSEFIADGLIGKGAQYVSQDDVDYLNTLRPRVRQALLINAANSEQPLLDFIRRPDTPTKGFDPCIDLAVEEMDEEAVFTTWNPPSREKSQEIYKALYWAVQDKIDEYFEKDFGISVVRAGLEDLVDVFIERAIDEWFVTYTHKDITTTSAEAYYEKFRQPHIRQYVASKIEQVKERENRQ